MAKAETKIEKFRSVQANWISDRTSDRLLLAGLDLEEICVVVDSGNDAAEKFRPFRFVLLVHSGHPLEPSGRLTPVRLRNVPPAAVQRSPRPSGQKNLPPKSTVFLVAVSATCFNILPLGLFPPAKTWPISGIATSNKFLPSCLATGRMYNWICHSSQSHGKRAQATSTRSHLTCRAAKGDFLVSCTMMIAITSYLRITRSIPLFVCDHLI